MNNKLLGLVYILIGLVAPVSYLLKSNFQYVLWFSNHTFLILGIAVFFNSRWWVMAEMSLGLVPELLWSVDYLWKVFTGKFIWGFTDYMFNDGGSFAWGHVSGLTHVLFVPAGILALYLLKGNINFAWAGSLIHGIIIFGLSFFLPTYNINCVYTSCLPFTLPFYLATYPGVMSSMAVATFLLLRIFFRSTET